MIDRATAHLPNADQSFLAVFSAGYFPDAQIVLKWVREKGGNVYRWKEKEMEDWLCPTLLKYFEKPPGTLYIQAGLDGTGQSRCVTLDQVVDAIEDLVDDVTQRVGVVQKPCQSIVLHRHEIFSIA